MQKFTMPAAMNQRAVALHPAGALVRIDGSGGLAWLDLRAKKAKAVEVPPIEEVPSTGVYAPRARQIATACFVGDRLAVLYEPQTEPQWEPRPALLRWVVDGAEVSCEEAPGVVWIAACDAGLVVHTETGAQRADGPVWPSGAQLAPGGRRAVTVADGKLQVTGDVSLTAPGAHAAWIDADRLALWTWEGEVVVLDVPTGARRTLGVTKRPNAGFCADARAVWVVRKGMMHDEKNGSVHRLPLDGGPVEVLELPGRASETCAELAGGRLAVGINWQKAAYVVTAS